MQSFENYGRLFKKASKALASLFHVFVSLPEAATRRREFAKFTGKRLCQGLFFNKVVGLNLQLY